MGRDAEGPRSVFAADISRGILPHESRGFVIILVVSLTFLPSFFITFINYPFAGLTCTGPCMHISNNSRRCSSGCLKHDAGVHLSFSFG